MAFLTADYLEKMNLFGIRLGLDAVRELAKRAGNPEKRLRFIHIAGTNGKGSTAAMLEHAFRACGFHTGLYTSPHLVDVRERFRLDGRAVSEEEFNQTGEFLAALAAQGGEFSYFEFTTVLALLLFARANVDIVLWETGMGGRLDATNIVDPEACVITNIALDHQAHLGNTLAEIAAEKAGILKAGKPLFHGKLPPEAKEVIYRQAAKLHLSVFPPREEVPTLEKEECRDGLFLQHFSYAGEKVILSLPGKMQRENYRIVEEILREFSSRWNFSLKEARASLASVRWPARFQWITPRFLLDGGHNPDGIGALAEAVRESFPGERFTIVYAAFADKRAEECIPLLAPIAKEFIFTSLGATNRASYDDAALFHAAAECGVPALTVPDALPAVEKALQDPRNKVIVSGSLFLAGAVLKRYASPESVLNLDGIPYPRENGDGQKLPSGKTTSGKSGKK